MVIIVVSNDFHSIDGVFFLSPFFLAFEAGTVSFRTIVTSLRANRVFNGRLRVVRCQVVRVSSFPTAFASYIVVLHITRVGATQDVPMYRFLCRTSFCRGSRVIMGDNDARIQGAVNRYFMSLVYYEIRFKLSRVFRGYMAL